MQQRRHRFTESQARAIARRRFGDAKALIATGSVERANGAIYLAGYAIETTLKAMLLAKDSRLGVFPMPEEVEFSFLKRWRLVNQQHDLDGLLAELPELRDSLIAAGKRSNQPYINNLIMICGTWSVLIRYSTQNASFKEASDFVDKVRVLLELMR